MNFKDVAIPGRLAHSGEVDIEPFGKLGSLVKQDCLNFIGKLFERDIAMESELGAITELARLRASFLCADGSDPLVAKIDIVMSNAVDFLVKPKEVRLDVVFLAVVTDGQKLELTLTININLAGMSLKNFHVSLSQSVIL